MMRDILQSNGVKTSGSPIEIVRNWVKWSRDPNNKVAYYTAKNEIEGNSRWLGDVSKMAKSPHAAISDYGFQHLKPYLFGRVNNITRDYNKIFTSLLTKEGVAKEAIGPAARQ